MTKVQSMRARTTVAHYSVRGEDYSSRGEAITRAKALGATVTAVRYTVHSSGQTGVDLETLAVLTKATFATQPKTRRVSRDMTEVRLTAAAQDLDGRTWPKGTRAQPLMHGEQGYTLTMLGQPSDR